MTPRRRMHAGAEVGHRSQLLLSGMTSEAAVSSQRAAVATSAFHEDKQE